MVLYQKICNVSSRIQLLPTLDGKRLDLGQGGIYKTFVLCKDAHSRQCVDCHQVLRVCCDTGFLCELCIVKWELRSLPVQQQRLCRLLELLRPDCPHALGKQHSNVGTEDVVLARTIQRTLECCHRRLEIPEFELRQSHPE